MHTQKTTCRRGRAAVSGCSWYIIHTCHTSHLHVLVSLVEEVHALHIVSRGRSRRGLESIQHGAAHSSSHSSSSKRTNSVNKRTCIRITSHQYSYDIFVRVDELPLFIYPVSEFLFMYEYEPEQTQSTQRNVEAARK